MFKKKVIHYTHASTSGAALYVYKLVNSVSKVNPIIFVCPNDFDHLASLSRDNVDVHSILPKWNGVKGLTKKLKIMLSQPIVGLLTLIKLKKETNIIHINFPGLVFFAVPFLFILKSLGFKIIYTVHDVYPHKWLLSKKIRKFEKFFYKVSYKIPQKLVVHHMNAKETLFKDFNIKNSKVEVVPHGTFSEVSEPLPYKTKSDAERKSALLLGSIRENKGIDLAIKAVQDIIKSGVNLELVIAGKAAVNETSYWEMCKSIIDTSPKGIHTEERYLDDEEIFGFLEKSDFVLLPYTDFESQSGIAVLAMSNGRPIVGSNSGGLRDLIIEENTGILIKEISVNGVKESILKAIDSHTDLKLMGKNAFNMFKDNFSWDKIAIKYIKMYNKVNN